MRESSPDDDDELAKTADPAFEPMTVVPPLPVLSKLEEVSGDDLAQISEILQPTQAYDSSASENAVEAEETAATELAAVQGNSGSEEELSDMFDFVTSLADSANKDP